MAFQGRQVEGDQSKQQQWCCPKLLLVQSMTLNYLVTEFILLYIGSVK